MVLLVSRQHRKEMLHMKKNNLKWGRVIAAIILRSATNASNMACAHSYYQPETPDAVKKLRKF